MRLVVLGGAAACPGPQQGCSSYYLEQDGYQLLLDCGPNTVGMLRAITDISTLDTLILSHTHSDHTLDLVTLRYGLKYAPGIARRRPMLWVPPKGGAFLRDLAQPFASDREQVDQFFQETFVIEEFDPEAELTAGPFKITFAPTRHYIPCWAIKVRSGESTLVYLADTAPLDSLVEFARDCSLLIAEATLGTSQEDAPPEQRGHLNGREAGEMAAAAGVRALLLTHLWAENDAKATKAAAIEAFGGPVRLASPGLELEV